jgi:CxxC-x17-CxxC domain-containing protein
MKNLLHFPCRSSKILQLFGKIGLRRVHLSATISIGKILTPSIMSDDQTTPPADDDAAAAPQDEAKEASTEEAQPAEEAAPAADGDKSLPCEECNKDFIFTAGEQEFYEEKGFTPPKRCPDCRAAKKAAGRQFTKVTCAGCGKETEVPFVPSGDRPVYCRECFETQKN